MKKAAVILLCILALALTSCDPVPYRFDNIELSEEVVGVELIEYDNDAQKAFVSWIPDHSDELLPFVNENVTVIEKLDDGKIPDFLEQLAGADVLYEYYAYNSPRGRCIRLLYGNGDFMIIWCADGSFAGYIGIYSPDGQVKQFIGSFSSRDYYSGLTDGYFKTECADPNTDA